MNLFRPSLPACLPISLPLSLPSLESFLKTYGSPVLKLEFEPGSVLTTQGIVSTPSFLRVFAKVHIHTLKQHQTPFFLFLGTPIQQSSEISLSLFFIFFLFPSLRRCYQLYLLICRLTFLVSIYLPCVQYFSRYKTQVLSTPVKPYD